MCGNGLRCLASFIQHLGLAKESCLIESKQGKHLAKFLGDKVSISIGKPKVMHWELPHPFGDESKAAYVVNTGVPHAVFFMDSIEKVDLDQAGKEVRFSPVFSPDGVNVNIVSVSPDGSLRIRTYERGVEGETLACGTGAVAAAYAASELLGLKSPMKILPSSSEIREVIREKEGEFFLVGPSAHVFSGEVFISK